MTVDRGFIKTVLVVAGLVIAFVVMLVGFDLVTASADTHVLGWGFLAVVLLAFALLL